MAAEICRDLEWALIQGKWALGTKTEDAVSQLARDTIDGKYSDALHSPLARELLKLSTNDDISSWQTLSTHSLKSLLPLRLLNSTLSDVETEVVALTIGVACLHAFVQVNWTGPDINVLPTAVVVAPSGDACSISEEALNRLAIAELAYGGEPAYHLAKVPAFLRIAQLLFDRQYQHCPSAIWWNLRTTLIHQYILDDPVTLAPEFFTALEQLEETLSPHPDLWGRYILEQGLIRHYFGHDKLAAELFVRSARIMNFDYQLTGALGKRTKFQVTDLSQLVVLARSRRRDDDEPAAEETTAQPSESKSGDMPETLALNDDTLLEQTEFTSTTTDLAHLNPSSQPALHPLDQCVLLGLCLNVKNTSPTHGLTSEQMSPYVARVISHPRNWSIHTMSLLLRARLESTRTRTVERSTLQLQALVEQMPTADSALTERLAYVHSLALPSKWEMEKELGMRYLSIGVVRSALYIFERLEMWEEVVRCWQAMERPEKAVVIVKDLLEGRKEEVDTVLSRGKAATEPWRGQMDTAREAKLWCLLGELEPEHAAGHYERAWKVSGETSGRAMRSLGGYHFARGSFALAIPCLNKSVAISPLLSRSWFLLGCAYMREETWEKARDAFARCVALDDEDAESWNNLASIYLRMGASDRPEGSETNPNPSAKEAPVPFEHKMLAFRALKQGLKYKYESWRMWSNYMVIAMDVGELSEACRALSRVVEERAEKDGERSVDIEVLERLVGAVTRGTEPEGDSAAQTSNGAVSYGLERQVTDLFIRIILPRISSSPRIFHAYARLLTYQQQWGPALQAHLNAYRTSVSDDKRVETDLARWQGAVTEVEELVDVMRNLGLRVVDEGEKRKTSWDFQARSILRTFMGRTKAAFGDEPEWERLTATLDDLRRP